MTDLMPVAGLSLDRSQQTWDELSRVLEEFILAWDTNGSPPEVAPFLNLLLPELRRMIAIELVKVDLEYRWSRQQQPRLVEDYFAEVPELSQPVPVDLLYEEFHIRQQAGDPVRPAEYFRRFPGEAAALANLLGVGEAMISTAMFGAAQRRVPELEPGERIDDFDILLRLGQGAFASVYLARQCSLQRLVALKVSADKGTESQTLAQLDHENIVRVFDQRVLPDRGLRLMYMQYAPGGTLQQIVVAVRETPIAQRTGTTMLAAIDRVLDQRGESSSESSLRVMLTDMPWPRVVCWIGVRLARALDSAHGRGVLHRDLKPANVLLTAEGVPKLADFNISFSSKVEGTTPAAYFGGSLAYMSPEQLDASHPTHPRDPATLDGRSDLYSLGVVLWELCEGFRPFSDEVVSLDWSRTLEELASRRRMGPGGEAVRRLTEAVQLGCSGLDEVLLRCLASDPDERFQSGWELERHLEICLAPETQRLLAAPPGRWLRFARQWPVVAGVLTALPSVLASVFNYVYNKREVIDRLGNARDHFMRVQTTINLLAFPIGIGLICWSIYRVTKHLQATRPATDDVRGKILARQISERAIVTILETDVRPIRNPEVPAPSPVTPTPTILRIRTRAWDDDLLAARRSCLNLGSVLSTIILALWLLAGLAYPIALASGVSEFGMQHQVHFFVSLTLCGLIGATYPFFLMTLLSLRAFYPALVRLETMTEADRAPLQRVSRQSWFFLLLAASLPLLSIGVLVLIESRAKYALMAVTGAGLVGFGLVFLAVQHIQRLAETLQSAIPKSSRKRR